MESLTISANTLSIGTKISAKGVHLGVQLILGISSSWGSAHLILGPGSAQLGDQLSLGPAYPTSGPSQLGTIPVRIGSQLSSESRSARSPAHLRLGPARDQLISEPAHIGTSSAQLGTSSARSPSQTDPSSARLGSVRAPVRSGPNQLSSGLSSARGSARIRSSWGSAHLRSDISLGISLEIISAWGSSQLEDQIILWLGDSAQLKSCWVLGLWALGLGISSSQIILGLSSAQLILGIRSDHLILGLSSAQFILGIGSAHLGARIGSSWGSDRLILGLGSAYLRARLGSSWVSAQLILGLILQLILGMDHIVLGIIFVSCRLSASS
jgi:hypothetical protein